MLLEIQMQYLEKDMRHFQPNNIPFSLFSMGSFPLVKKLPGTPDVFTPTSKVHRFYENDFLWEFKGQVTLH